MSNLSSQVDQPHKRHIYLVDRKLQLRFIFQLIGCGLVLVLVSSTIMFFWGRYLLEKSLYSPHLTHASSGELLLPLLLGLNLLFAGLLIVVISFFTRRHLHKLNGSLFRLESHLSRMGQGEMVEPLTFRSNDPLQSVGEAFNLFSSGVKQRRDLIHREIRSAVAALQKAIESSSESSPASDSLEDSRIAMEKACTVLDYERNAE